MPENSNCSSLADGEARRRLTVPVPVESVGRMALSMDNVGFHGKPRRHTVAD
jgi:hypothetical protein